ncbi:MAG: hypothetical protein QNJ94_19060 [Alphaproteobacteria bacterium]|nr:hypothetical protein [Alphaproteobacteria bacterium]
MRTEERLALYSIIPKLSLLMFAFILIFYFSGAILERIRESDQVRVNTPVLNIELLSNTIEAVKEDLNKGEWPDWASAAIRERAARTYTILAGKNILWVDNEHPKQNAAERKLLRAIGLNIDSVRCPSEAKNLLKVQDYDAVIVESSVFVRSTDECGPPEINLEPGNVYRSKFVDWLSLQYSELPIIAYSITIGGLRSKNGVPPGLFGATTFTPELINLIMDALERRQNKD